MWINRITLDFIKHEQARTTLEKRLLELCMSDENITDLNISTTDGYVIYKVILRETTRSSIHTHKKEFITIIRR